MSDDARPVILGTLVRLPLQCGVELEVLPIKPALLMKISTAARELYPDPDPEQYKTPMKNPLVAGDMNPGESNPLYKAELDSVNRLRSAYILERVIGLSCRSPYMHEIMAEYAWQLNQLTEITPVYVQWAAIIRYYLATPAELDIIADIAQDKAPLREDELVNGFKTFRLEVSTLNRSGIS